MTALDELVLAEAARRGKVTFAEFMDWALYHPQHGYYTSGAPRTGRQGDFYTNVHSGSLFARLLVESFLEMWDYLGSGRFTLVELGAGDGVLAERIFRAFEEKGRHRDLSYFLVERSPWSRELARRRLSRFARVRILDDLRSLEHTSGVEGCVFSNEFFDALPFHRVLWKDGALRELYVVAEGGRLVERPAEPSTPRLAAYLKEQGVSLAEGQRTEICLLLEDLLAELERSLARGFVFSIDYGEPSLDLQREDRVNGTRQVYRKHRLLDDPFEEAGERDITAFVDFGRLAALGLRGDFRPLVFASQGAYFLNSAEDFLRRAVEGDGGRGGDVSLKAAVQQLLHPRSLGGAFQILIQGKNVGDPVLRGGRVNRLHRLASPSAKK